MNIINRGFIFVKPKNPFITWAQSKHPALVIDANAEGSVYLIEEEFWDDELVFKQYAAKIAEQEFGSIIEDQNVWPQWNNLEEFEAYFSIEMGCTCIDMRNEPLQKESF
jgi:hypothetical protein